MFYTFVRSGNPNSSPVPPSCTLTHNFQSLPDKGLSFNKMLLELSKIPLLTQRLPNVCVRPPISLITYWPTKCHFILKKICHSPTQVDLVWLQWLTKNKK